VQQLHFVGHPIHHSQKRGGVALADKKVDHAKSNAFSLIYSGKRNLDHFGNYFKVG